MLHKWQYIHARLQIYFRVIIASGGFGYLPSRLKPFIMEGMSSNQQRSTPSMLGQGLSPCTLKSWVSVRFFRENTSKRWYVEHASEKLSSNVDITDRLEIGDSTSSLHLETTDYMKRS